MAVCHYTIYSYITGLAGVTYTRWGRTSCGSRATTLYWGYMAGSWWSAAGGAANYLCLPRNPQYLSYRSGYAVGNYIYGTEYQLWGRSPYSSHLHDDNVPCVVCEARGRYSHVMIPAWHSCPSGWTEEYYGYLMSSAQDNSHQRTMYECIDRHPQSIYRSWPNRDGAVIYHVEAKCHGLPCPPYNSYKELACVVCTK